MIHCCAKVEMSLCLGKSNSAHTAKAILSFVWACTGVRLAEGTLTFQFFYFTATTTMEKFSEEAVSAASKQCIASIKVHTVVAMCFRIVQTQNSLSVSKLGKTALLWYVIFAELDELIALNVNSSAESEIMSRSLFT